ncbi:hypothetical protein MHLNE_16230 [Moorella humiferrea]|uniref:hypothetical protein n=1 Tax=Neomoorella humiferrea TaxID=676965 RepID=UPI0030CB5848
MVTIKSLNKSNFARYGSIIEFTPEADNFQVQIQENGNTGWRIALLKVNNKSINTVSCHPNSMETFEPLEGTVVLIVAKHEKPEELEAFLLDKPVCVKKSIWHNLLALSSSALVKITENAWVESEIYELGSEFKIVLGISNRPQKAERRNEIGQRPW